MFRTRMTAGWFFLFLPAVIVVLMVTAPYATAQWSGDPAVNFAIADSSSDQVQPKIEPTTDGGCYISWFDNSAGGYDVRLQRLDAGGNEQWAHNGVLIADRSFSSTEDYGLDIDSSGNALLAFRDDRTGSTLITAVMVTPGGSMPWGATGVQLTSGEAVYSPRIAGTSDGYAVVGWTQDSSVKFQKLDASGAAQWGPGVMFSDTASGSFFLADLHGSDAGNVIASWVRLGPNYWDPKHLYAQKLSPAGATLWNTPGPHVIVFDNNSLQFGNFPPFVTDGGGGAVFSWYGTGPLQCYAQHILSDGTEAFGHNGSEASTNGSRIRVSPSGSYNPATGETFLFWEEENSTQTQYGVYGQKFDSAGTRQWTDNGVELVPISSTLRYFIENVQYGDGAMVFFLEEPSMDNDVVYAARVDGAGRFTWAGDLIQACSTPSGKSRLTVAMSAADYAIVVWEDSRSGDRDVYGQNVNPDGSFGYESATIAAGLSCVPASGTVPFNTTMTVTLTNNYTGQTRRIAGRINVVIAGGNSYNNWKSGWTNVTAGSFYTTAWNQAIPALGSVIGDNVFTLEAEDVTPAPYNQPPEPPAGDTATDACTVIGIAP